jgi:hypothetical protein
MTEIHLEPTQESGAALFSRNISGPLVMLNLLQFREEANYSEHPGLKPDSPISGREAYHIYIEHTLPFLESSGGEIIFLGEGGKHLIGPQIKQWDLVMLVRQRSLTDFMAFASNKDYLAGIGHRVAALLDSRLLPIAEMDPAKL